jgi:hypothetical protein
MYVQERGGEKKESGREGTNGKATERRKPRISFMSVVLT